MSSDFFEDKAQTHQTWKSFRKELKKILLNCRRRRLILEPQNVQKLICFSNLILKSKMTASLWLVCNQTTPYRLGYLMQKRSRRYTVRTKSYEQNK
jgi:hypothetical protein